MSSSTFSAGTIRLSQLPNLQPATISAVAADEPELHAALEEMGFEPGREVEVMARGLFGGTPIAVRLDRSLIALRRREAAAIEVELTS